MKKRFVCFSLSLAAALAALVTQFSPPRAAAQQPPRDEPSAECVACEESCNLIFQACLAERGSRGPGRGQCTQALQECRRSCDGRGGPCDKRADSAPDPEPIPTPSPTATPTPD